MNVTLSFEEQKAIIKVSGMITTDYSHLLAEKLDEVQSSNVNQLDLDFSTCRIICSTGIGKIVAFANQFNEKKGKIIVTDCSPSILDLFTTIKLDQILTINL